MDDLGRTIKMAREKAGLSVQDVSEKVKILSYYLEAIENNDFKSLPSRVYAVGFIRCYAEFLDLEPQKLCDAYKAQMGFDSCNDMYCDDDVKNFFSATSKNQKIFLKCAVAVLILIVGVLFIRH